MLKTRLIVIAALVAAAAPAAAQVPDLGGAAGAIGEAVNNPLREVDRTTGDLTRNTFRELRNARQDAIDRLLRENRAAIDTDRDGEPVIRHEVVAIAPTSEALTAARAAGFNIGETVDAEALGLSVVVLQAPRGMSTRRALDTLRRLDPDGAYDYNHIYFGAGQGGSASKQAESRGVAHGARIGLIDSGVDAAHPSLVSAALEQRGFGGRPIAGDHGTAIASILVGAGDSFEGAAPGAALYVADVYGGRPTGGGASAIVAALAWLVQSRAAVINVSLVGPPNRALQAAVEATIARGVVVVAAVGNDGPAAGPLYPAAYQGVVGVTGVDARDRVLPEAGRGAHVDFAAPGADFSAAGPRGGYTRIRGTSYAAPIVAGLIAQRLAAPDALAAQRAEAELERLAVDLGDHGRDNVYGAGLVGREMRAEHMARR